MIHLLSKNRSMKRSSAMIRDYAQTKSNTQVRARTKRRYIERYNHYVKKQKINNIITFIYTLAVLILQKVQ